MDALLFIRLGLWFSVINLSAGCYNCSHMLSGVPPGYAEVSYQASEASIINPERGGAILLNCYASDPTIITSEELIGYRENNYTNIIWRQYYLDSYITSDIPLDFIGNVIEVDLWTLRFHGFKASIRFAYTSDQNANPREASLPQILEHILQLKGIMMSNSDVILSVQVGFIGVWGEWYYSTHFGDEGVVSESEWSMRREVVAALLDAVPSHRYLQIRTPAYKRAVTLLDTPVADEDYKNSSKNSSRIGHHNDCFLASETDFGTYTDVAVDYPYLAEDSKYTLMGGETCASNPPRSNCETAMKELSMFHWSFMNLAYQREVLDGWREEGCFDEIFNKLGYRLRLVSAVLPSNTSSGADACFLIKFRNDGYAAPVNPRYVKLILRSSTEVYISEHIQEFTKAEPWLPESGVITVPFSLQLDVPPGQYELLLELGDPILAGNPDYNIILLNSGVVELDSAINSLGHSITVTSPTLSGSCSGFSKKFFGITTSSTLRCYSKCEDLNVRTTTSPMTSTTPSDQLPIITSHCTNNLIRNGAMDSKAGFSRKSKFRVVSEAFHGKSFRVACGKKRLGFFQIIRFDESERVRSLVAAVYSKLAKVRRRWKNTGKHSLRVDLKFSDDTKKSNINIAFEPSTDWYRNILRIEEDKDIVEATVWCRCTDKKRVALFDELALMVAPAVCET